MAYRILRTCKNTVILTTKVTGMVKKYSKIWKAVKSSGPSNWEDGEGDEACGLDSQSPIDIVTSDAEDDDDLEAFTFTYTIGDDVTINVENNGHTGKLYF